MADDFQTEIWDDLRDGIVDDVLEIQRQQIDQEQEQQFTGSFEINPQTFFVDGAARKHLVVGPIPFESPFQSLPHIEFGQKPYIVDSDIRVDNIATNYIPFLVKAYTYAFSWETGLVDGFYVGLYALTEPSNTSTIHTISWHAIGAGSRYLDERTTEAWTEPDDMNQVDFLTEDAEYSPEEDEGYYDE